MCRCLWEGARDKLGRFGGKKSKTSFLVTSVSSAEGEGADEVGHLRRGQV